MQVTYSLDRTTRYTLPTASDAERAGATVVTTTEAKRLANSHEATCADKHCSARVWFVHPSIDGQRVGYWRHESGASETCGEARNPEGVWHRYVCRDLLGAAMAHEYSVPHARADVVVRRVNNAKICAVEVQHSPIKKETVQKRHQAHRDAGIISTLWVVDARRAANGADFDGWSDDSVASIPVDISKPWVNDLIDACREAPDGYSAVVGFLMSTPRGHVLRFIDTVRAFHDPNGTRVTRVVAWSKPVPEHVLRDWAAGPDRRLNQEVAPTLKVLDAAATRRVKTSNTGGLLSAKMNAEGTRIRLALSRHDAMTLRLGEILGLTWFPGHRTFSDGTTAKVGYLAGEPSSGLLGWLAAEGVDVVRAPMVRAA